MKRYLINEVYLTIHGEGVRYGIPHVFVRFSKCNLTCGFCDTEFESGEGMTALELLGEMERLAALPPPAPVLPIEGAVQRHEEAPIERKPCRNVLLCGGEPLLQVDQELVEVMKEHGWYIAVETNGTRPVPPVIDWVTLSPKVAEHAIVPEVVNEVKYVRGHGQGIPRPKARADHYLVSPVFDGDQPDPRALAWCAKLVQENPAWRLTVQHHKLHFGDMR